MSDLTLLSGDRVLARLPDQIKERGYKRVLIVHGKGSYRTSGADEVLRDLSPVSVHHFDGVTPNPEIETVRNAVAVYRDIAPDCVIAVGGGSVIDTAKAMIAAAAAESDDDLLASRFELSAGAPALIAVPTTAGSGSEATHFAVMYVGKKKYSLAHPQLKPATVVLDPRLSVSCPRELTLAAASDALCQSIESWWSNGHTDESRSFSRAAVPVLDRDVPTVVTDPENVDVRMHLLLAAHNAGRAIDISKTTAGHALSYGLTSTFGIPHGLAVLAIMQFLIADMHAHDEIPSGIEELRPGLDDTNGFIQWFDRFSESVWGHVDAARYLASRRAGSGAGLIDDLARGVNIERLSNHPGSLTEARIRAIYRATLARHAGGTS